MKSILCFGDSLTFGADPEVMGKRHAFADRWPSALEAGLGADKVRVIAEGLGGRTTVFDDWNAAADRNGARILPTLLESHSPLDAIIIMLGTNDIKPYLGRTAGEAGRGMVRLGQIIKGFYLARGEAVPHIVFVSPPEICDTDNVDMITHFGGKGIIEESKNFKSHYRRRAEEVGAHFFDAASVAKADPADGVHLDAENTQAIGTGLVPLLQKLLAL